MKKLKTVNKIKKEHQILFCCISIVLLALITAYTLLPLCVRSNDLQVSKVSYETKICSTGIFKNFSGLNTKKAKSHQASLSGIPISEIKVYPGGMPFGIKFHTNGVMVVGFSEIEEGAKRLNPAIESGIKIKDLISKINGRPISSVSEFTEAIENSQGKDISISLIRAGCERSITLTPAISKTDGKFKAGIMVKDSGAGIGTVTFIIPENKTFAGLGHGICDPDTGELIPMNSGDVLDVTISSVIKGQVGVPGELKGFFSPGRKGALLKNSECGLYGTLSKIPESITSLEPVRVAPRNEVKNGKAYILSTLDSNKINRYEVEISEVNHSVTGPKCFTVRVTDPALLALSGGIVQGMSGSPIIQNGKLIGAVTHVLINDPTKGYGIFAENMLTY